MSHYLLSGLIALMSFTILECRARNSQSQQRSSDSFNAASGPMSVLTPGQRQTNWSQDHYLGKVQPLLASRCAVCHGCTESPCGLKLTSYDGLRRGATQNNFYSTHLGELAAPYEVPGVPQFHSVLPQPETTSLGARDSSILYQWLQAGQAASNPDNGALQSEELKKLRLAYDDSGTFQCPATPEKSRALLQQNRSLGMPFGLPRLVPDEFAVLDEWIAQGAPGPSEEAQRALETPSRLEVLHEWETFLNTPSPKGRLTGRFIYEHTFSAHYHFDEMPGEFYALVRTKNAPPPEAGEIFPPEELYTQLPTDDPTQGMTAEEISAGNKTGRSPVFFYRFKKVTEVITRKNHIPWRVNRQVLARQKTLFLDSDWDAGEVPGYQDPSPFRVFANIPQNIRHTFLNEQSQILINAMVRAPVCVGATATYAIADHFWIWFLKPESEVEVTPEMQNTLDLDLRSITFTGEAKAKYDNNHAFISLYENALRAKLEADRKAGKRRISGLNLDDIWYGEGALDQRNAWLTVMRHQKSTTVHFGHEGGFPQSIWVLSYPNFERLYYNLVVQFKYWGSIKHKLSTWQSMSHERLHGEEMFLSFLPFGRTELREIYSGGIELPFYGKVVGGVLSGQSVKRYLDMYPMMSAGRPSAVDLPGKDRADVQISRLVAARMPPVALGPDDFLNSHDVGGKPESISLPSEDDPDASTILISAQDFTAFEKSLRALARSRGKGTYAPSIPDITYLRVRAKSGEARLYSFIRHRGYLSHNLSVGMEKVTAPERDTISILRGAVGDFPQLFLDVSLEQGAEFLSDLSKLRFEKNSDTLQSVLGTIRQKYAVERHSPEFWPFVDWLHQNSMLQSRSGQGQIDEGILDLKRYDIY